MSTTDAIVKIAIMAMVRRGPLQCFQCFSRFFYMTTTNQFLLGICCSAQGYYYYKKGCNPHGEANESALMELRA
jgi:hypothetical protein